ncbi:hypothetical protein [Candidatus Magnetomonas plexicatena]|uniref:hypothetical protein n=1 Tax=Candidatus Magnetomonas plexicatena TaxID=2552947 RepID=UPI001101FED3|nr:hypothetical protein E2O03_005385 [Nitrospirales bacterium LBB_01]
MDNKHENFKHFVEDSGMNASNSGFSKVTSTLDLLNRLASRTVAEDAVEHSINWLMLTAWANLEKMKKLKEDMLHRITEAKKIAGIMN